MLASPIIPVVGMPKCVSIASSCHFSFIGTAEQQEMTDDICATKIELLDRLINDPSIPMQPDLIWSLLDEITVSPQQEINGKLSCAATPIWSG